MLRRFIILFSAVAVLAPDAVAQTVAAREVEFRVLSHQALVRTALDALLPPERRVSQWGVEVSLPSPWKALRADGRILRSERGSADLNSIDAGLVIGWPALALAAGYGIRASYDPASGLAHGRNAEFGRAGLRLRSAESHTRFTLHLRGDKYIPTEPAANAADELSGWDAEGGVTWRAKDLPFTATLGYRLERFRIFSADQEVSALTFALGLAFGGR